MTATIVSERVNRDNTVQQVTSEYLCEHETDIHTPFGITKVICTDSDIDALVVGRLYADGLISSADDAVISISPDRKRADVSLPCIRKNEPYIMERVVPESGTVFMLADMFGRDSGLHRSTRSTHRCMLLHSGEVRSFDDISRHNAVDKAVGYALMNRFDMSACIMFSSGRVPSDMAQKVIAAHIPVLVSKADPTAQAVETAKKYGLTLICRAWPDSYEVFS
ncbi:MAG: formate dehydrogenase accessory sulfurtransferase FdhD [Oscillospiraceae bacterium]|nr:formate dehydrogenase accessory sulfurtransferase FdhD [Oscillospiraceae bacterium]